jgi:hypothetical protein
MAAGIDGARLMKVARLRTERGEWNDVGKLEEVSGGSQWSTRRKDQKSVFKRKEKEEGPENFVKGVIGSKDGLFLENSRQCCDEAGRRRRVSSSVAKSLGQDCDFPLCLMCGLAHCCRRREKERERERERENWRDNQRLWFVRNCVRGQCLCFQTMYTIHE